MLTRPPRSPCPRWTTPPGGNFSDLEQHFYLLAGGHDNLVLLPVEVVRVLVRVVGRLDLSRGGHGGRLDRLPGGGEALVHHAAVAVENNYSAPLLFNIILIITTTILISLRPMEHDRHFVPSTFQYCWLSRPTGFYQLAVVSVQHLVVR